MNIESSRKTHRRGNHGNYLALFQYRRPSRIFMGKTQVVYLYIDAKLEDLLEEHSGQTDEKLICILHVTE